MYVYKSCAGFSNWNNEYSIIEQFLKIISAQQITVISLIIKTVAIMWHYQFSKEKLCCCNRITQQHNFVCTECIFSSTNCFTNNHFSGVSVSVYGILTLKWSLPFRSIIWPFAFKWKAGWYLRVAKSPSRFSIFENGYLVSWKNRCLHHRTTVSSAPCPAAYSNYTNHTIFSDNPTRTAFVQFNDSKKKFPIPSLRYIFAQWLGSKNSVIDSLLLEILITLHKNFGLMCECE